MKDLIKPLEALVKKFPTEKRTPIEIALNKHVWVSSEEGKTFLSILSQKKELEMFNGKMQQIGHGATRVDINDLVDWLITQAQKIGSEAVIGNLSEYLSLTHIDVNLVELCLEAYCETEFEFCNGVKLISPHNLKNEDLANSIHSESVTGVPFPKVTFVLSAEMTHPVLHYSADEKDFVALDYPYKQLIETRLCLSLARNPRYGIFGLARTFDVPLKYPIKRGAIGWSILPFKFNRMQPHILNVELESANDLLRKHDKLDDELQEQLFIPMTKLNNYGSGDDKVDSSIELRTCMEALFLDGGNKEQLSYRLSLRAALYLGESFEERQKIFRTMKDAYNVSSRAVHNGKFSKKDNPKVLDDCALLVRKAIIKMINEGKVDWEEIELQKNLLDAKK